MLARIIGNARCWGFFEYFLVTPLQGAVAITKVNGIPLAIGEHLDLHVTGVFQEFFHVDRFIAKGRFCL